MNSTFRPPNWGRPVARWPQKPIDILVGSERSWGGERSTDAPTAAEGGAVAIQRGWDPLVELQAVQKRMNTLFESALARTNFETADGFDSWTPVCDVLQLDKEIRFCLELPGLEQSDIDLRLEGDELIVQGQRKMEREQNGEHYHRVERSYGSFTRRFSVPSTVDREGVEAKFTNGLLEISLPKTSKRDSGPVKVAIR
jgi:HSP20 family protein